MDRCTINTFDEPAFKSFSISIFKQESHDTTTWLGEQGTIDFRGNLGSGSYQDQSVGLKLAFYCKCLTSQAYVGDDGMFQQPKTPLADLGIGNMKARHNVQFADRKCNNHDIEFEPAFDKFTHSKPGEYELAEANTKCVSSIVPKGGEIHLEPGSPHYRAGLGAEKTKECRDRCASE